MEQELLDMLERLADAAEALASSDPEMSSHEQSVADFDAALDAARALIANVRRQ